jgi:hypothetical protein
MRGDGHHCLIGLKTINGKPLPDELEALRVRAKRAYERAATPKSMVDAQEIAMQDRNNVIE